MTRTPLVICTSCGTTAPAAETHVPSWQASDPDLEPDDAVPPVRTLLRCAHCGSTALAHHLPAFRVDTSPDASSATEQRETEEA